MDPELKIDDLVLGKAVFGMSVIGFLKAQGPDQGTVLGVARDDGRTRITSGHPTRF